MTTYEVKEKDTLWKISRHFGITVEAIAAANNLKGRQLHYIRIGQVLTIPNSVDIVPESLLKIDFRGLDFSSVTPKKIKLAYDSIEEERALDGATFPLELSINDHALGLQVWIETPDKQSEKVCHVDTLPLGTWKLSLDSRMIKGDGALQPKKGPPAQTKEEVRKAITHNAQLAGGKTQQQQTRTEAGEPTHGLATVYTGRNLRLSAGNERYRQLIIVSADKYGLTPQSLAALIDAEAKKIDGVWQEKSNQEDPTLAQGLAQFFEAAWTTVYQDKKSLLYQECARLNSAARLAKRLEAKYAIDGAASLASTNLETFEKTTNYRAGSLPPEDKAKLAYLLHHEGLTGALRLFGKKPQLSDEDLVNRLRKQLGKKNVKALNNLMYRYDDNASAAYKGWLFAYIDAKICVDNFIIDDAKKFARPPRAMAAIAKDLATNFVVPKPKAITHAKPAPAPAPLTPPRSATSAPSKNTSPQQKEKSATSTINTSSRWHDPLDVCTLRTAGLAGKRGAMFGWTRSGGKKNHQGIDLVANPGTPIYAVADGTVHSKPSTDASYAYGNTLVLEVSIDDLPPAQAAEFRRVRPVGKTIGFFYAHLSELPDERSKPVKCGDIIGKSGSTGNANKMTTIALGAHLHFEVRLDFRTIAPGLQNRVDPLPFIEKCTNR
jgi:murein DD-endopeptidase MepM/ murein hydrolase activator NlpD